LAKNILTSKIWAEDRNLKSNFVSKKRDRKIDRDREREKKRGRERKRERERESLCARLKGICSKK
jgi:hypothetical protein